METLFGACTYCGGQVEIADINSKIGVCPYCKRSYVTRNALGLAKVEVDKTKELLNLRKLLEKAIKNNHIKNIIKYSNGIREIIPDDVYATYFYAYGESNIGYPSYLEEFYTQQSYLCTGQEMSEIVLHIINYSDLRDKLAVENFLMSLDNVDNMGLLKEYKTTFAQRKSIEENYEIVKRDVFICHRSVNNDIAQTVLEELERDGNKCWIATRNLRPNDAENYWDNIQKALEKCKVFLVISSEDAMLSQDVKGEINMAVALNKPRIEYKIDNSTHTSLFKDFFNGKKWVDGRMAPTSTENMTILCRRVYEEIRQADGKPLKTVDFADITQKSNIKYSGYDDFFSTLSTEEKLVQDGEEFLCQSNYFKARDCFSEVVNKNDRNARGWFGLVRSVTKDLTEYEDIYHPRYIAKALKNTTDPKEYEAIDTAYEEYARKICVSADLSQKKRYGDLFVQTVPDAYYGYLSLAEYYSKNLTELDFDATHRHYFLKAYSYANDEMKAELMARYQVGVMNLEDKITARLDNIIESNAHITINRQEGGFRLTQKLKDAIIEKINVLLVVSPNNPKATWSLTVLHAISTPTEEYKKYYDKTCAQVTGIQAQELEAEFENLMAHRQNYLSAYDKSQHDTDTKKSVVVAMFHIIFCLFALGICVAAVCYIEVLGYLAALLVLPIINIITFKCFCMSQADKCDHRNSRGAFISFVVGFIPILTTIIGLSVQSFLPYYCALIAIILLLEVWLPFATVFIYKPNGTPYRVPRNKFNLITASAVSGIILGICIFALIALL